MKKLGLAIYLMALGWATYALGGNGLSAYPLMFCLFSCVLFFLLFGAGKSLKPLETFSFILFSFPFLICFFGYILKIIALEIWQDPLFVRSLVGFYVAKTGLEASLLRAVAIFTYALAFCYILLFLFLRIAPSRPLSLIGPPSISYGSSNQWAKRAGIVFVIWGLSSITRILFSIIPGSSPTLPPPIPGAIVVVNTLVVYFLMARTIMLASENQSKLVLYFFTATGCVSMVLFQSKIAVLLPVTVYWIKNWREMWSRPFRTLTYVTALAVMLPILNLVRVVVNSGGLSSLSQLASIFGQAFLDADSIFSGLGVGLGLLVGRVPGIEYLEYLWLIDRSAGFNGFSSFSEINIYVVRTVLGFDSAIGVASGFVPYAFFLAKMDPVIAGIYYFLTGLMFSSFIYQYRRVSDYIGIATPIIGFWLAWLFVEGPAIMSLVFLCFAILTVLFLRQNRLT